MATAQEIYDTSIRQLSDAERLRLAALILGELTESVAPILDYSDSWSDEDIHDLTVFSLRHAASRLPDEDDIA